MAGKKTHKALVTPNRRRGTRWENRLDGRVVSRHRTKKAALAAAQRAARKRAKRGGVTSTRIRTRKGKIAEERTLPRRADKFPPRG
jgi:hypothetical protein